MTHVMRRRERNRASYWRHRASGKCASCGKPTERFTRCRECREKYSTRYHANKEMQ